jgi:hypothetical protein
MAPLTSNRRLLLRSLARAGMRLPSRCLAVGIQITIYYFLNDTGS